MMTDDRLNLLYVLAVAHLREILRCRYVTPTVLLSALRADIEKPAHWPDTDLAHRDVDPLIDCSPEASIAAQKTYLPEGSET